MRTVAKYIYADIYLSLIHIWDVRKQIHIERRRHIPILSNNLDGYYLPSSKEEKDRCVDSLRRRAAEILEAADAIEKAEW